MRALSPELLLPLAGIVGTPMLIVLGAKLGEARTLELIAAMASFAGLTIALIKAPHYTLPFVIPFFVALPALKIFVSPSVGPVKDAVVAAAALSTILLMVRDKETAVPRRVDGWVLAAVCALLGLYVLNLGAGFHGYGLNWVHGTRLTAEPLLLLLYGFSVREPRRTYRAAIRSMALTACAVAAYGLLQQLAGAGRLISWGYSYSLQVRLLPNGLLRSFGTLDDPFAYAALLLLAFAVTLFGIRRSSSAIPVGIVVLLGLAVSYVRTAAVICVALVGLALLMRKHTVQAFTLLAASFFAGIILAVAASTHGATESRTVRGASPDIYLTLNGRTTAWKAALGGPLTLPFGRGVGTVGRAAQRAAFSVTQSPTGSPTTVHAVDSGYFSTVADVGLVGLTVLLVLFGRLVALAARAAKMRAREGWLALGLLTVMLFDALTRDSFAGFPTAFLGLLLVGLALANVPSAEARRGTVR